MYIWNPLIYEITSIRASLTACLLPNFNLLGVLGTSYTFETILSIYNYAVILYFGVASIRIIHLVRSQNFPKNISYPLYHQVIASELPITLRARNFPKT